MFSTGNICTKHFLNLPGISKISMASILSQSWESKKTYSLTDPGMSCLQYVTAIQVCSMPGEVLVLSRHSFQLP